MDTKKSGIFNGEELLEEYGPHALFIAINNGAPRDVLRWLVTPVYVKTLIEHHGNKAIFAAIAEKYMPSDILECLTTPTENGNIKGNDIPAFDINITDDYNNNLLVHATMADNINTMQWLENKGLSVVDSQFSWPDFLHPFKIGYGCDEIRENATLMHAAAVGNAGNQVIQSLHNMGLAVNGRDSINDTPMHYAAYMNSINAMNSLQKNGGDHTLQNMQGNTAMHMAAMSNAINAMEWLKKQDVDVNVRNHNDETPLFYAVKNAHRDTVKWLKKNGADIKPRDKDGFLPIGP